jgi:hypothetical protein
MVNTSSVKLPSKIRSVMVLPERVWVSVVPTIAPAGDVFDVVQADPVDTAIPAPGYTWVESEEEIVIKSEPSQAQMALTPERIVAPVVTEPLRTTEESEALITMYALERLGAIMLLVTPAEPVTLRIAQRASFAAPEPVVERVQFPEVTLAVAVAAMASSTNSVMLSLTVSPQVLESSPVTGRANPKRLV